MDDATGHNTLLFQLFENAAIGPILPLFPERFAGDKNSKQGKSSFVVKQRIGVGGMSTVGFLDWISADGYDIGNKVNDDDLKLAFYRLDKRFNEPRPQVKSGQVGYNTIFGSSVVARRCGIMKAKYNENVSPGDLTYMEDLYYMAENDGDPFKGKCNSN